MTYKTKPTEPEQPIPQSNNGNIYKVGTAVGAVGWLAFAACAISHCGKGTTPVIPTATPTATSAPTYVSSPVVLPTAIYTLAPAYTPTAKAGKTAKSDGSKKISSLESKVKDAKSSTTAVQQPAEAEEDGLKKKRKGEEP